MKRLRLRAERGFTLIELLVVIAIIGILAAIAIPQFAAYRRRGIDADVKSNIKNAATAEEAYFVDKSTYTGAIPDLTPRGFRQSADVTVGASVSGSTFITTGAAAKGCTTGGTWSFESVKGVLTGTPCG